MAQRATATQAFKESGYNLDRFGSAANVGGALQHTATHCNTLQHASI